MQFDFLVWFENPHIERAYGQKQLIAARTPLFSNTPLFPDTPLASRLNLPDADGAFPSTFPRQSWLNQLTLRCYYL
ncbi:hypothetical protein FS749_007410 [Ceratobasidium sp. UAMH 11750]|nr:hypothetical protein FS749_007410 [Ceratobasidium sp. UAMH 11750]